MMMRSCRYASAVHACNILFLLLHLCLRCTFLLCCCGHFVARRQSSRGKAHSCGVLASTATNLQARRRIISVLRSNQAAPERLADMFKAHSAVLGTDVESHVQSLMEQEPPLSLEDFQDILEGYREQAESVRLMCCDTVRTGIYACALLIPSLHRAAWRTALQLEVTSSCVSG